VIAALSSAMPQPLLGRRIFLRKRATYFIRIAISCVIAIVIGSFSWNKTMEMCLKRPRLRKRMFVVHLAKEQRDFQIDKKKGVDDLPSAANIQPVTAWRKTGVLYGSKQE
jgi:hypothetical protein